MGRGGGGVKVAVAGLSHPPSEWVGGGGGGGGWATGGMGCRLPGRGRGW